MQDPEDRQRVWDTIDDIRSSIERGEEIPGVPLENVLAQRPKLDGPHERSRQ